MVTLVKRICQTCGHAIMWVEFFWIHEESQLGKGEYLPHTAIPLPEQSTLERVD